ncbi:NAD(P)-binding protein [Rhizodiscina lignyota]|uniref:NAD(P)-binding protein n=1 Tax=Rhizodiscina lignyota TaxID=1504668 RepID=A0A9P4IL59_9PEZI|nr:NAD(P)-binding protein [Rhizodiscina lignyota]
MSRQKVLLLGATGETGGSILNGLLADKSLNVSVLIREASLEKPATKAIASRNVPIIVGDSTADVATLTSLVKGFDVVISAIDAASQLAQANLVDAAAAAGVKRFVPCGFMTIVPPGGIMLLRDQKEEINNRIFRNHLPYTIIDVGFWHILSVLALPSGKSDYVMLAPNANLFGDGNAPNLLTHLPDIGKFVAEIVKDPRTLNKRVVTWSDELSQNQIFDMMEDVSGEKIERQHVSEEEFKPQLAAARKAFEEDTSSEGMRLTSIMLHGSEYANSKFFRRDNTLENAKYLGYLDARELYPGFKPTTFREFLVNELLPGRAERPYPNLKIH